MNLKKRAVRRDKTLSSPLKTEMNAIKKRRFLSISFKILQKIFELEEKNKPIK